MIQRVLVTAGASGIGLAIAKAFVADGFATALLLKMRRGVEPNRSFNADRAASGTAG
jgi:NAD(P)-dependent dehydrogenase (short-subunit alcohol dehydrogenase family)